MAGAHAIPALRNDSLILQRATYLLWIGHKLERIADHCTNICERLVFIIEGENGIQRSQAG
jgi:phosphate transport system protein